MKYKFELVHVDTCLSDYWSGHHLAHVQIPVYKGMTLKEIKGSIFNELKFGAIAGSNDEAFLLSSDFVGENRAKDAEKCFNAAIAAVNRVKSNKKGQRTFFKDLEEYEEDSETIYAFFCFVPID